MTPLNTLGIFTLSLLIVPLLFAICLKAPKLVVLAFIAVLFLFSSSSWGQLEAENTVYARGTGLFYFSLLNLMLLIAGTAALTRKLSNPHAPHLAAPLSGFFLAFVFLLVAHIVIGLMSGIELMSILSYTGIINILNMLIFMYLVMMAFNHEGDKERLLLTIIALAACRSAFGLVRFFWFDGDSANPYRNFEQLDVKIFFFDIADNFIASLGAFCAAWWLSAPGLKLSKLKRLSLILFLTLEIAAVALSFRRSSLFGLALMFCLLLYRLPSGRRLQFIVLALGLLAVTATVFFQQRLQFQNSGDILSALLYDVAPAKEDGGKRFYELFAAAKSMGDNWLFGLGAWGKFTGDEEILAYHFGKFDFVHSGFGHIVLKTGIAGLLLFCALLLAYASFYFRQRKYLAGNPRLLADAGFAGFLFWIPTLLVGTPIIEFRTMLLIGLTLAMPFVAVGLRNYRPHAHAVT